MSTTWDGWDDIESLYPYGDSPWSMDLIPEWESKKSIPDPEEGPPT